LDVVALVRTRIRSRKKSNSRNGISYLTRERVMRLFSLNIENIERRNSQSKKILVFFFFFDLLIARVKTMLMCPRRGLVYNILIVRVHPGRNIRGRKVGREGGGGTAVTP
jgi:hypothetical protein